MQDASAIVIYAAMTRTQPSIVAARRDASHVRTDSDYYQPFRLLGTISIRLRIMSTLGVFY